MNRGKRSVDDFDLIELAGANPNDEIEEKLPIEVICCLFSKSKSFQITLDYETIAPGQVILNLEPARQPLKDNMKYFIAEGNEDKIFRIYQVQGRAKLHFDKRKVLFYEVFWSS